MDADPIRELADRLAARIIATQDELGEDAFVRSVALLVEVDAGPRTRFYTDFADDRPWVQTAFLYEIAEQIEARRFLAAQQDDE